MLENLFDDKGSDLRFDNIKMQSYYPLESLTQASQMSFSLPPFLGPNAYLPNKLLIQIGLRLTTEAGNTIAATKRVSPINNIIHSLFKSVRVWVGETLITPNADNYHYKSFLTDYLSMDGFAKYTWMTAAGWNQDSYGRTLANQTSTHNRGFENRRKLFRNADDTAYLNEIVYLTARPHTDFLSTESWLIPGLGLRFEFQFASNDFLIQVPKADTGKYKLTIANACLMCPVAQLSANLFQSINRKLNAGHDAKMYYTRSEVTHKTIGQTSSYVERLFAGQPLPSRIVIGLVPTTSYYGTVHTTPYFFARTFCQEMVGENEQAPPPRNDPPQEAGTSRFFGRRNSKTSTNQQQRDGDPDAEEEDFEILGCDTGPFVKKVSMTLNGESLDGYVEHSATRRHDISNYMRLQYYQGFTSSGTGNNATYDEFMHGYYFLYFDLTTSLQAGLNDLIPAVRQGNLLLKIQFSAQLPIEVTLILYAEYPSLMRMDKNRQISLSY